MDEKEYEQLKDALISALPLDILDIERLAAALAESAEGHIDDEDLECAAEAIDLLFACFDRLTDSEAVQEALCTSALYYIDNVGSIGDLADATSCTDRLKKLNEYGESRQLTRTYANALVLNIVNFSSTKMYNELEGLVQRYAHDPIMPAMLAWAKLNYTNFNDLTDYFAQHQKNVLVAGIYARACLNRFDESLSAGNYAVAYGGMLPELERLVRSYGSQYRAYGDVLDYDFSPYWPNWLDHYFTQALADAAVDDVENNDLQRLRDHYDIFVRTADYSPETAAIYQSAEQQMLSNLAQLYGRNGDYIKAKEAIDRLRDYAGEDEEAISSLTDALYNLITQCAEADVMHYRVQLKAMASELEALAAQTDDIHDHTRYTMALYNISNELEKKGISHLPMWDLLCNYSIAHTVSADMADIIATEEMSLTGSADNLRDALMHRGRVKAMYEIYGENMMERAAATDYNLLIVALSHGETALAEEMLQSLFAMADEYADNVESLKQIVLRIAKGALMLTTRYGDMNAPESEFAVYLTTVRRLIPFAGEPEVGKRLTKMALNLCIDLLDAKRGSQAQKIYEELVDLPFDQESADRMKKLEGLLRGFEKKEKQ